MTPVTPRTETVVACGLLHDERDDLAGVELHGFLDDRVHFLKRSFMGTPRRARGSSSALGASPAAFSAFDSLGTPVPQRPRKEPPAELLQLVSFSRNTVHRRSASSRMR